MAELCDVIARGIGAVVIAEEALRSPDRERLLAVLDAQPTWSDIPLIVLTGEGELARAIARGVEEVARRGNATLLERPVRVATLALAVRAALRARRRQYELRDQIAERERLYEAERRARHEADEANRAKSQFLAVMSHELRTPLNAIAGYAELIDMGIHGPVTPEQREALRRVMKSEQHLLGLINAVLNYARVETGSVQFDIEDVPVDDVLATCETFVTLQARAKGLALELPAPEPSLVLRADREKVQQILLNLLSNAIKFTEPSGRVAVTHHASESESGTPTVRIVVTDTGRGIPAEKLEAIFEPFVQVDVALTRTQDGVGLGLAISRELARAMHGNLEAASTVGQGTTLVLTLPRALPRMSTVSGSTH
jgi:signal transduction histidine kinase